MKRVIFVVLLKTTILTGCAGEQALRTTASGSAGVLNQYRTALTGFAEKQNQANAANVERIERYRDMIEERRSEVTSRRRAWRLSGDKRAMDRLETVAERSGEDILTSEVTLTGRRSETPPAVSFDPAPVNGIIQRLVAFQEARSPVDRARDFLAFTIELRESYDTAISDAASATTPTPEAPQGPDQ